MDTEQAVKVVEDAAALADNGARMVGHMEIGQVVRQGDIYLHRVAASHPRGAMRTGNEARQLAIGTNANARHMAEPPAVVHEGTALPPECVIGTFPGPLVESPSRFTVSHPEHAAICLPGGTYQVTHQMDARTLDRVAD